MVRSVLLGDWRAVVIPSLPPAGGRGEGSLCIVRCGSTKSRKVLQKQSVAARDHRTTSRAEQAMSEDPGITQINFR